MRRREILSGLAMAGIATACASEEAAKPFPAEQTPLQGRWHGWIVLGSTQIAVTLAVGDANSAQFIVDQGDGQAEPLRAVLSLGRKSKTEFSVPKIGARFTGVRSGEHTITGTLFTGGSEIPVTLVRTDKPESLKPAPHPPLTAAMLHQLLVEAGSPAIIAANGIDTKAPQILVDGLRSAKSTERATASDLWHLGSLTKSMTATLVARLSSQRIVGWDQGVRDLPSSILGDTPSPYADVTLRHLLSHRAGLPKSISLVDLLSFKRVNPDSRDERQSFSRKALLQKPIGKPGERFEYSNSGYVIAGALLEHLTGKPWEVLISEHVFAPLGITQFGFGAPGKPAVIDQPRGHSKGLFSETRVPAEPGADIADNPAVIGPAGTVHMAASDVILYLRAHLTREARFLPDSEWQTLHTPPFGGNYAMGLIRRPDGTLWHNGSNTLWYAEVLIDHTRDRVAFAASNDGYLPKAQVSVGSALLSALEA